MTVKMTYARVDYKGRLHLTTRDYSGEYTTIVCENLIIEVGYVANIIHDGECKRKVGSDALASFRFDVRYVTVSNRPPKKNGRK